MFVLFTVIRTVAYGVYSIKETGLISGISVFFLAICVAVIGYFILFGNTQAR